MIEYLLYQRDQHGHQAYGVVRGIPKCERRDISRILRTWYYDLYNTTHPTAVEAASTYRQCRRRLTLDDRRGLGQLKIGFVVEGTTNAGIVK